MRFILSTGSLYNYSVDRVFALAAEAGFDGIEVLIDHRWDSRQSDYLRQLMESHQLPVPALHSPFSRNCSGWGETEQGAIARTTELAAELGSQVVIHHLPTRFGHAFLQTARGNRLLPIIDSASNVVPRGGGIGQAVGMSIGTAVARPAEPTMVMIGDGGLAPQIGELATLAQEDLPVTVVVFDDGGYGVLRNTQDQHLGRRSGVDLLAPDLASVASAFDLGYCEPRRVRWPRTEHYVGPTRW